MICGLTGINYIKIQVIKLAFGIKSIETRSTFFTKLPRKSLMNLEVSFAHGWPLPCKNLIEISARDRWWNNLHRFDEHKNNLIVRMHAITYNVSETQKHVHTIGYMPSNDHNLMHFIKLRNFGWCHQSPYYQR